MLVAFHMTGSFHAKKSNTIQKWFWEQKNKKQNKKKQKKLHPRLAQKNVFLLHDINASSHTALIYCRTYKLLQVAIVVTPSVQPRPCPLRLLFPELKKGLLETNMRLVQGRFDFSCKSASQQKVCFMVWRGNTKALTKMAKVYRLRWRILWKKNLKKKKFNSFWEQAKSLDIFRPPLVLPFRSACKSGRSTGSIYFANVGVKKHYQVIVNINWSVRSWGRVYTDNNFII